MANLIIPIALIVIVVLSGAFLSPRYAWAVGVFSILALYWLYNGGIHAPSFQTLHAADPEGVGIVFNYTSTVILVTAAGVSIMSWLRTQAERSLQAANAALTAELVHREHLTRLLLTAQEDERRRIARDLHDGALGDLSATIVALDVLTRRSSPATPDDLRAVRTQVREVAGQVREVMNNLRPTILDDSGLAAALTQLAHKLETRAGLPIQVRIEVLDRLEAYIETTIFRVAQEALANIIQHAQASNIRLTLATQEAGIELTIEDDGQGFEPESARRQAEARGHIGLASLGERVEGAGGRVEWASTRREGTRLRCWFPYPAGALRESEMALTSTGRG